MKKLSLINLKLGANDMLQRNELKTVFGGYGGDGDGYQCCNYWVCGMCVTGSSEDCSSYGGNVWGQSCTPE